MVFMARLRRERPRGRGKEGTKVSRRRRRRNKEEENKQNKKKYARDQKVKLMSPPSSLPSSLAAITEKAQTGVSVHMYTLVAICIHRRWCVVLICPLTSHRDGLHRAKSFAWRFRGWLFSFSSPPPLALRPPEKPIATACPAASRTLSEWYQRPSCGPGRRCVCQIGVISPQS